jgi:hypothetical protein
LTPHTFRYNPHIYGTIHLNMGRSTHICEHNHAIFTPIDLKTCVAYYAHGYCEVGFTYVSSGESEQNRIDSGDYAPKPLRQ